MISNENYQQSMVRMADNKTMILSLNSKEQLNEVIEKSKKENNFTAINTLVETLRGNSEFESFNDFIHRITKISEENETEFANIMKNNPGLTSEDELIDEDYFSKFLNSNKEIIVGDTLYKYLMDNSGVLKFPKKDISQYMIYRNEHSLNKNEIMQVFPNCSYTSLISENDNKFITSARAAVEPSPSTSLDGVIMKEISYNNNDNYIDFPNLGKRRLKVKYWSRNWVLYKTLGVKVVIQKQTSKLFNWWGSVENHDYIKVRIANYNYSVKFDNQWWVSNVKSPVAGNNIFDKAPNFKTAFDTFRDSYITSKFTDELEFLNYNLGAVLGLSRNFVTAPLFNDNLLHDLANKAVTGIRNAASDKIYALIAENLPEEWKGQKKYLEFYTWYDSPDKRYTTTKFYAQDREYSIYNKGIIDEQVWKEWQGLVIGTSGIKNYNISEVTVDKITVEAIGSLNGVKVGIRMTK